VILFLLTIFFVCARLCPKTQSTAYTPDDYSTSTMCVQSRKAGAIEATRRALVGSVQHLPVSVPRSGIKPCNPKNQIWSDTKKNWYLSRSGCGIKSGIHGAGGGGGDGAGGGGGDSGGGGGGDDTNARGWGKATQNTTRAKREKSA
jgi:uncharacterized membrane protein YgcG